MYTCIHIHIYIYIYTHTHSVKQVFANKTPVREGRMIMFSSQPRPQSSNLKRKCGDGSTTSGVFFAHRSTPSFTSSTLTFWGTGFESRSVCFWSGCLFCKHWYHSMPSALFSMSRHAMLCRRLLCHTGISQSVCSCSCPWRCAVSFHTLPCLIKPRTNSCHIRSES